jgi:6-phosphogluconolactonase
MTVPKTTSPIIQIDESPAAVAADAAEEFVELARQAQGASTPFRVALSGGATPRLLYGLLASDTFRNEVDWGRIQFFFGDERWVPHTSKDSNYKLANDELFTKVPVNRDNVFPIPTEGLSPDEAAEQYEQTLRVVFGVGEGEVPRFELIFLGIGDDGHTASLFPHTSVLKERHKLVAAPYVERLAAYRITLTPPVLWAAKEVLFMAVGEDKAPALKQVLEGPDNFEEYPSQLLKRAQGKVTWLVDSAAASTLEKT